MLQVCPDCGYSLNTLPEVGRCPECGFAYGRRDLIVVYGFHPGDPAEHKMRSEKYIERRIIITCVSTAAILTVIVMFHLPAGILGYCAAAVVGTFMIASRSKKLSSQGIPAPVQLRVTPDGYATREGTGTVTTVAWPKRLGGEWRLTLRPARNKR